MAAGSCWPSSSMVTIHSPPLDAIPLVLDFVDVYTTLGLVYQEARLPPVRQQALAALPATRATD